MQNLTFSANLSGIVNDQEISLTGKGVIVDGHTDGQYELHHLPDRFSETLLSAILITGYPNASTSYQNTPNIFIGRSYRYQRKLTFRDGGELRLKTNVELNNGHLHSTFDLSGTIQPMDLESIQPLVESWDPVGAGKIWGHFTASWKDKVSGKLVTADANTEYTIDTTGVQEGLLHRFVKIQTELNGCNFRKIQDVVLFKEIPIL